MKAPRIMYMEKKLDGVTGPARIGRVTFNKSGKTIFYGDQIFRTITGGGFKTNFYDEKTGERYWISGPKKNGQDRLYSGTIEIDADVAEEYWTEIRGMPESKGTLRIRAKGKYKT